MTTDALDSRLRALEDEFFYQVDLKLNADLREKSLREGKRERLSKVLKVQNEAALDDLIDHGIDEQTVAVLLLVPLAFVAWADGHVTEAERETVFGVISRYAKKDSAAFMRIMDPWLKSKPSDALWDAWQSYIKGLREQMSETAAAMAGEQLFEHARRVAEASTSFLSLHRIGADKQRALDKLRDALQVE